jgi:hypothetical protein
MHGKTTIKIDVCSVKKIRPLNPRSMTSSTNLFELCNFPLLWYFRSIIVTYALYSLPIGRYVVVMPQGNEGAEFTGIHAPVNNQTLPSRMI